MRRRVEYRHVVENLVAACLKGIKCRAVNGAGTGQGLGGSAIQENRATGVFYRQVIKVARQQCELNLERAAGKVQRDRIGAVAVVNREVVGNAANIIQGKTCAIENKSRSGHQVGRIPIAQIKAANIRGGEADAYVVPADLESRIDRK